MRKYIIAVLAFIALAAGVYLIRGNFGMCPLIPAPNAGEVGYMKDAPGNVSLNDAFTLLKGRKDNEALVIFEQILVSQPDNLHALWGKAEVLRRSRNYKSSQELLNKVLGVKPDYIPALISLSYIKYKDDLLSEALKLINRVLKMDSLDRENQALAYVMLGSINSRRSQKGWFFSKIAYGTNIKCHFFKAKELAPELAEVYLGLGTFYLLAPAIVGGDLDKALEELESAVRIAPEFATANARLAQAHKKKGNLAKYNFHIQRARDLDPQNEVLKELKQ